MAFDDIGWYLMVLDSKHWFEYPIVLVVNLGVGIFKFENRDIQIWKLGFSNLKIEIFKFENKNDAV